MWERTNTLLQTKVVDNMESVLNHRDPVGFRIKIMMDMIKKTKNNLFQCRDCYSVAILTIFSRRLFTTRSIPLK
jgi:hypothetical protein